MQKKVLLAALIFGWFQASKAQDKHLKVGDMIPSFSLRDQNDTLFNISDYTGKENPGYLFLSEG